MTLKIFPGASPINGDAVRMQLHEISHYRAAAHHARRLYQGPLGDLVFRELTAYADFGYRFSSNDGLVPRLAAAILATSCHHQPAKQEAP